MLFRSKGIFTMSWNGGVSLGLPYDSKNFSIALFSTKIFLVLARSITASLSSLLFMFWCIMIKKNQPGQPGASLIYPHLDEAFHLNCTSLRLLFLYFYIFLFVYAPNDSLGILDCIFWWNIIDMIYFIYMMDHFLRLHFKDYWICWKSMSTIHFWCFHNVYYSYLFR